MMRKLFCIFFMTALSVYVSYADIVRFAFITDTHFGLPGSSEAFMACLKDINAQDSLDFVLIGGDITDMGTDAEIKEAKEALDKLKHPYWLIAGNHDSVWSESGCNTFLATFGYEQFEFEAGGYRFLGCNCGPDMRMGPALVPQNSMLWLKSLEKGKPMIFLNHTRLDKGLTNWFDVRRELIRLDCRALICGHGHRNRILDCYGLPGMMGRTSIYRGHDNTGYNIITIKDGVFEAKLRTIEGYTDVTESDVWYSRELLPITDTLTYDADGLPSVFQGFKFSQNKEYPEVKVRWSRMEDANIGSGFACDGIRGWYATASGKVVCMTLKDGNPVWRSQLGGKIYATAALKDNILVVPCTDGDIYAFNASTGELIWKHHTSKGIVASPAIYDKCVYVGSSDGHFRALRLKDGKLLWEYSGVVGFCSGAPYVDNTQVVFTTWGQRVYSLDPKNGALQWVWVRDDKNTHSPGACSPVKSGKRVFIVAADRRTYCVDASTGTPLFMADCGRESFVLSEDKQVLYVKAMFGTLHALPTQTPLAEINGALGPDSPSKNNWKPDVPVLDFDKAVWNVESGLGRDVTPGALYLCGETLLVPSETGLLHAFNRNTGDRLWKHKVGIGPVNPVVAWQEKGRMCILTSSMDGQIKVLEITR